MAFFFLDPSASLATTGSDFAYLCSSFKAIGSIKNAEELAQGLVANLESCNHSHVGWLVLACHVGWEKQDMEVLGNEACADLVTSAVPHKQNAVRVSKLVLEVRHNNLIDPPDNDGRQEEACSCHEAENSVIRGVR